MAISQAHVSHKFQEQELLDVLKLTLCYGTMLECRTCSVVAPDDSKALRRVVRMSGKEAMTVGVIETDVGGGGSCMVHLFNDSSTQQLRFRA